MEITLQYQDEFYFDVMYANIDYKTNFLIPKSIV
jgi:hypothetical protein